LYGVIFQDQNELSKSLRKLLLSWDYIIKNKLIVRQHQTKTTTASNISMVQSAISTETNENDSNVLEEIDSVQNQQINNVNQEPAINHSFNHTQELDKP
jgi:hypothetical protein